MDFGKLFLDLYNLFIGFAKELHWDQITIAGVAGWGIAELIKYLFKTGFNKVKIGYALMRKRTRLRKLNKKTETKYDNSIITFDTALPAYLPENAKMFLVDKSFIFEIPQEQRARLKELDFAVHEPAKLDGDNHQLYKFLKEHYPRKFKGCYDGDNSRVDTFIQDQIIRTANYFIDRKEKGKLAFNNEQVGVYNIKIGRTSDGAEKQKLDLQLYKTDYFTAQVMVHIYQKLRDFDEEEKTLDKTFISPLDRITERLLNNEMPHFMSSLGVGGYIIFDRGLGLEYWTVKRGTGIRNGSNQEVELRNYSFDETMDFRDATLASDRTLQEVSIIKGADRAVEEELGLFKNDKQLKDLLGDFNITNLILILTKQTGNRPARFEMQLLGYKFVHFKEDFTYRDLQFKKKNAQDSSWEAVEVYCNKLTKKLVAESQGLSHTPESAYYADVIRNAEQLSCISRRYYNINRQPDEL